MNWYLCSLWEKAQLIQRARLWTEAVASVISMEDMFNQFTSRFALTEEERLEVVVDSRETLAVKTTRFLLIGKLLANKPYNKEAFKRTMANLWKPKARVTIVDIGHDRFSFAFPSQDERTKILSGGPWFQQYVFSPEYRKPVGRRFGLSPEHPRIFSVPTMEEETTEEVNEGDALPLISHNRAAVITVREINSTPLPHADMGGNHNCIMDTSSLARDRYGIQ
ncbi:hypothetical protein Pyn_18004 [Prunus yedoensis var. nudiflora]|uniref:DUF4283 domain-containing protein n=1 Tax=Prunus yedoensis var. nudiflora TaxID=2094558 RepID=A0A314Y158_PRUYE|nr:hypothetical protein Pyn_18004 [Prunus yedoensis var. nudiflora]